MADSRGMRRRLELDLRKANLEALEMLRRGILRRAQASQVSSAVFQIATDLVISRTDTR